MYDQEWPNDDVIGWRCWMRGTLHVHVIRVNDSSKVLRGGHRRLKKSCWHPKIKLTYWNCLARRGWGPLPSVYGIRLQFAIENCHRNSWFTTRKKVIFHSCLYVYERVPGIVLQNLGASTFFIFLHPVPLGSTLARQAGLQIHPSSPTQGV